MTGRIDDDPADELDDDRFDDDRFDDDRFDDDRFDDDVDPDRLAECAYWRCDVIFETRGANHRYCRKACRSRQKKWERAQARKAAREARRR